LSAYSESPKYAEPPLIEVSVYPNSSFAQLSVLAPVLPHNEVYRTTLHHNEVYKTTLPHIEVSITTMPQNEVYKILLAQNEGKLNKSDLPLIKVFKID